MIGSLFISLTNLDWREPLWLLLLLQPVIVFLLQRLKSSNQLNRYAEKKLHQWVSSPNPRSVTQRIIKRNYFFVVAWVLFSFAMAGPRTVQHQPGNINQSRLDVMLVVDISRSMQAVDVKPERLKRAQIELYELLRLAKGQRFGMVVYSARPHLYFPLTADRSVSEFYLKSLDSIRLPTQGSDVIAALMRAKDELTDNSKNQQAIVLITDGDFDITEKNQQQLTDVLLGLKSKDIPVFILGVGSVEGDAIPVSDGSWLMENDNAIVSRMNESILEQMADRTGGLFSRVEDDNSDWQLLYGSGLSLLASPLNVKHEQQDVIWKEYYPWLLVPGCLLFFIVSLPFSLKLKKLGNSRIKLLMVVYLVPFLMLFLSYQRPVFASESQQLRDAGLNFQQENYSGALEQYKNLNGYQARFGEGASRYRIGDYSGAVRQFAQAVLEGDKERQRVQALYNLANSYYQLGNYQTAIEVYDDVLRYNPADRASHKNRNVSIILLQQIEARQKLEQAARVGGGAKSGAVAEGESLTESSRVSISDDVDSDKQRATIPLLPDLSNKEFERLIEKGIKYAKHSASGATISHQPDWQQQQSEARFLMQSLEDNHSKHLQRLFEMEEGFAAPVEDAVNLPGVKPW